jgi:hypothetical protein
LAFNGSGVFQRLYSWVNDAAANIKIRADRMDAEMDGFATGLSTCITKDGQTTVTANLPMATFIHTGVGAATARTHYSRTDQVQDGSLNWVDGGGTSDAITAAYSIPLTALIDGQLCYVRATAANATTTPTFSPSSLTARTIVKSGNQALVAGDIFGDGHELILRYRLSDTKWELLNPAVGGFATLSGNNTFSGTNTFNGTTNLKGAVAVAGTSSAGASVSLAEDTDNGTNKVTVKAPDTLAADYTLTLPADDGGAGEVLATDGSGALSWQTKLATMVAGSVVQVVQVVKSDTFTSSGNSYQDITGLAASITPTSASNKILVFVQTQGDSNTNHCFLKIVRGASDIGVGDAASSRTRAGTQINVLGSSGAFQSAASMIYLDSPATTSSTTYKVQGIVPSAGTFYINKSQTDTDSATFARTSSSITLVEVKA